MPADQPRPQPNGSPTLSALLPLLHESLAREGRFVLPLTGVSMAPTLPAACRVEIVPLPPDPQTLPLGSQIVFATGDLLITHRLVVRRRMRGEMRWIAQGDGRRVADVPVLPEQVLGYVVRAMDETGQPLWPRPGERGRAVWWILRHHGLAWLHFLWRRLRPRRG